VLIADGRLMGLKHKDTPNSKQKIDYYNLVLVA